MDHLVRGQISSRAAEIYEDFFLPALFEQWADVGRGYCGIHAGERVLDVACGTGVCPHCRARVGATGWVGGLDVNEGMLAMAARKAPGMTGATGRRSHCRSRAPASTRSLQFGLMFIEDRERASRDAARAAAGGPCSGRRMDRLDHTPGYAAMAALLQRLFGDDAAKGYMHPSTWEMQRSCGRVCRAGFPNAQITTARGRALSVHEDWSYGSVRLGARRRADEAQVCAAPHRSRTGAPVRGCRGSGLVRRSGAYPVGDEGALRQRETAEKQPGRSPLGERPGEHKL